MLITNACLYSPTPVTAWLNVNKITLPNGLTAYQLTGNIDQSKYPDGQYGSARASGDIIAVNNVSINESFLEENGVAKVKIGEGYRVLKVV